MSKTSRRIIMLVAMINVTVGLVAAGDPFEGTWKLNLAKSESHAGPQRKSIMIRIEPYGKDGIKQTNDIVDAQDKATQWSFSGNYDGKVYPVMGFAAFDAVTLRRIDRYTTEATTMKGGKVMSVALRAVSKDGTTFTITARNPNTPGGPPNSVEVFDKQ